MDQTKELAALFSYLNICLDNGSSHFLPLPSLPRIPMCIVSIQASRIKRSGIREKRERQVWVTRPIA